MHARKAHDELLKLVDSAPGDVDTLVKAAMLLDGLQRDNTPPNSGELPNGAARVKIDSARGWFEILCGVGEDGEWPDVRHEIRVDLAALSDQISHNGLHFKR